MLDAHTAPDASARVPVPHTALPALPATPRSRPPTSDALFTTAGNLLPVLEAGRPLDAATLRDAMTSAFGASDAQGAWVWKDAYEAAEAAVVLFIRRHGRAMRRHAGGRSGRTPRHAEDAGGRGRPGALPHQAFRRADPAPAVLHSTTARLRRVAGSGHPAGRHGAGAVRRYRHAGGDGRVRARKRAREPPSERDRGRATHASVPPVPRDPRHCRERREHRRPPAGRPAHRHRHEPAVLGNSGRPAHPPRRRTSGTCARRTRCCRRTAGS